MSGYEIDGLISDEGLSQDAIRIVSSNPVPTKLIDEFSVELTDSRAEVIRRIGVGGVCNLSGVMDGSAVQPQVVKIEAIEQTSDGGIRVRFIRQPEQKAFPPPL